MRKWINFETGESLNIEKKLVGLAEMYDHALILSDHYSHGHGLYKTLKNENLLAGIDALNIVECNIEQLPHHTSQKDWYFGFLTYDLKNEIHKKFENTNHPRVNFPNLFFFRPRWLVRKQKNGWSIGFDTEHDTRSSARKFWELLISQKVRHENNPDINLQPAIGKEQYLQTFHQLQHHIQRGDIYEINYCIEFFAEKVQLNPAWLYDSLMQKSPMPFSAFLKHHHKYAISASPERYLCKKGSKTYSMPMKGTAPRGVDRYTDEKNLQKLKSSLKERAENVMITDLVRNDLSRVAAKGSVKVEELFGTYKFPTVYQVVSTISAELKDPTDWTAPIIHTFPMGSMTGAPKLSAMQLIDRYETRQRGLFSGAVGYIDPERNFDFNVMIRSLFYDQDNQTASYSAGSAITALSDPEDEYNECLLKAGIVREG